MYNVMYVMYITHSAVRPCLLHQVITDLFMISSLSRTLKLLIEKISLFLSLWI